MINNLSLLIAYILLSFSHWIKSHLKVNKKKDSIKINFNKLETNKKK